MINIENILSFNFEGGGADAELLDAVTDVIIQPQSREGKLQELHTARCFEHIANQWKFVSRLGKRELVALRRFLCVAVTGCVADPSLHIAGPPAQISPSGTKVQRVFLPAAGEDETEHQGCDWLQCLEHATAEHCVQEVLFVLAVCMIGVVDTKLDKVVKFRICRELREGAPLASAAACSVIAYRSAGGFSEGVWEEWEQGQDEDFRLSSCIHECLCSNHATTRRASLHCCSILLGSPPCASALFKKGVIEAIACNVADSYEETHAAAWQALLSSLRLDAGKWYPRLKNRHIFAFMPSAMHNEASVGHILSILVLIAKSSADNAKELVERHSDCVRNIAWLIHSEHSLAAMELARVLVRRVKEMGAVVEEMALLLQVSRLLSQTDNEAEKIAAVDLVSILGKRSQRYQTAAFEVGICEKIHAFQKSLNDKLRKSSSDLLLAFAQNKRSPKEEWSFSWTVKSEEMLELIAAAAGKPGVGNASLTFLRDLCFINAEVRELIPSCVNLLKACVTEIRNAEGSNGAKKVIAACGVVAASSSNASYRWPLQPSYNNRRCQIAWVRGAVIEGILKHCNDVKGTVFTKRNELIGRALSSLCFDCSIGANSIHLKEAVKPLLQLISGTNVVGSVDDCVPLCLSLAYAFRGNFQCRLDFVKHGGLRTVISGFKKFEKNQRNMAVILHLLGDSAADPERLFVAQQDMVGVKQQARPNCQQMQDATAKEGGIFSKLLNFALNGVLKTSPGGSDGSVPKKTMSVLPPVALSSSFALRAAACLCANHRQNAAIFVLAGGLSASSLLIRHPAVLSSTEHSAICAAALSMSQDDIHNLPRLAAQTQDGEKMSSAGSRRGSAIGTPSGASGQRSLLSAPKSPSAYSTSRPGASVSRLTPTGSQGNQQPDPLLILESAMIALEGGGGVTKTQIIPSLVGLLDCPSPCLQRSFAISLATILERAHQGSSEADHFGLVDRMQYLLLNGEQYGGIILAKSLAGISAGAARGHAGGALSTSIADPDRGLLLPLSAVLRTTLNPPLGMQISQSAWDVVPCIITCLADMLKWTVPRNRVIAMGSFDTILDAFPSASCRSRAAVLASCLYFFKAIIQYDPELSQRVIDAGALPLAAQLCVSPDAGTATMAMNVIQGFAASLSRRPLVASSGAIPRVMRAVESNSAGSLNLSACLTLGLLCRDAACANEIVASGGVDMLLFVVDKPRRLHVASSKSLIAIAAVEALQALETLARSKRCAQYVLSSKFIEIMLGACKNKKLPSLLRGRCLALLCNLATVPAWQQAVIDSDVVEVCKDLLKGKFAREIALAMDAIERLMRSRLGTVKLCDESIGHKICDALKPELVNREVLVSLETVLRTASSSQRASKVLVAGGVAQVLETALARPSLAGDTCKCLSSMMLSKAGRKEVFGRPVILQRLLEHLSSGASPELMAGAADLITMLAESEILAHKFVDSGAVPLLVRSTVSDDEKIKTSCAIALSKLLKVPNVLNIVLESVGTKIFSGLLNSSDSGVVIAGCSLVSDVSGSNDAVQDLIDSGASEALVGLSHSLDPNIRQSAIVSMGHLASGSKGAQALVKAGAVEALLTLVSSHDTALRAHVCWSLANVVHVSEGARQSHAAGAVSALLWCVSDCSSRGYEGVSASFAAGVALSNVLAYEDNRSQFVTSKQPLDLIRIACNAIQGLLSQASDESRMEPMEIVESPSSNAPKGISPTKGTPHKENAAIASSSNAKELPERDEFVYIPDREWLSHAHGCCSTIAAIAQAVSGFCGNDALSNYARREASAEFVPALMYAMELVSSVLTVLRKSFTHLDRQKRRLAKEEHEAKVKSGLILKKQPSITSSPAKSNSASSARGTPRRGSSSQALGNSPISGSDTNSVAEDSSPQVSKKVLLPPYLFSPLGGLVGCFCRISEALASNLGSARTILRATADVPPGAKKYCSAYVATCVELLDKFLVVKGKQQSVGWLEGALGIENTMISIPAFVRNLHPVVGPGESTKEDNNMVTAPGILLSSVARLVCGRPLLIRNTADAGMPAMALSTLRLVLHAMQSGKGDKGIAMSGHQLASFTAGTAMDALGIFCPFMQPEVEEALVDPQTNISQMIETFVVQGASNNTSADFLRACWFLSGSATLLNHHSLVTPKVMKTLCSTVINAVSGKTLRAVCAALAALCESNEQRRLVALEEGLAKSICARMSAGDPAAISAVCILIASLCNDHSLHDLVRKHKALPVLGGLFSCVSPFAGIETVGAASEAAFVMCCDANNTYSFSRNGAVEAACKTLECPLFSFSEAMANPGHGATILEKAAASKILFRLCLVPEARNRVASSQATAGAIELFNSEQVHSSSFFSEVVLWSSLFLMQVCMVPACSGIAAREGNMEGIVGLLSDKHPLGVRTAAAGAMASLAGHGLARRKLIDAGVVGAASAVLMQGLPESQSLPSLDQQTQVFSLKNTELLVSYGDLISHCANIMEKVCRDPRGFSDVLQSGTVAILTDLLRMYGSDMAHSLEDREEDRTKRVSNHVNADDGTENLESPGLAETRLGSSQRHPILDSDVVALSHVRLLCRHEIDSVHSLASLHSFVLGRCVAALASISAKQQGLEALHATAAHLAVGVSLSRGWASAQTLVGSTFRLAVGQLFFNFSRIPAGCDDLRDIGAVSSVRSLLPQCSRDETEAKALLLSSLEMVMLADVARSEAVASGIVTDLICCMEEGPVSVTRAGCAVLRRLANSADGVIVCATDMVFRTVTALLFHADVAIRRCCVDVIRSCSIQKEGKLLVQRHSALGLLRNMISDADTEVAAAALGAIGNLVHDRSARAWCVQHDVLQECKQLLRSRSMNSAFKSRLHVLVQRLSVSDGCDATELATVGPGALEDRKAFDDGIRMSEGAAIIASDKQFTSQLIRDRDQSKLGAVRLAAAETLNHHLGSLD